MNIVKSAFLWLILPCWVTTAVAQSASFTPDQLYRIQNINGYADFGSANLPVTTTIINPITGLPQTVTNYPVGPLHYYQFRTNKLGFSFEKNIISESGKFSTTTNELSFNFASVPLGGNSSPILSTAMFITKQDGKIGIGHISTASIAGKFDLLNSQNKLTFLSTSNFTADNLTANMFRVNRDKTKALVVQSTAYLGGTNTKETFVVMGNGATHIGEKWGGGPYQDALLSVYGKIVARSLHVTIDPTSWADYVFDKKYPLLPLSEVEKYYLINKHLPEIPSSDDVKENGVDVGEMEKLLLKKIEELTLYIVSQQKEIESLKKEVDVIKNH